jgi:hypothetical protein
VIAALAGRRIDAPHAEVERFPERCITNVRERIRTAFQAAGVSTLVSAAACGADLIALMAAEGLGLRRHIIIPSPIEEFRAHSVVDRPGDWGPIFDRLVSTAQAAGDLELIQVPEAGSSAYLKVNVEILNRASILARDNSERLSAFAVWDGALSGHTDYTQDFVQNAQKRGIPVESISIV